MQGEAVAFGIAAVTASVVPVPLRGAIPARCIVASTPRGRQGPRRPGDNSDGLPAGCRAHGPSRRLEGGAYPSPTPRGRTIGSVGTRGPMARERPDGHPGVQARRPCTSPPPQVDMALAADGQPLGAHPSPTRAAPLAQEAPEAPRPAAQAQGAPALPHPRRHLMRELPDDLQGPGSAAVDAARGPETGGGQALSPPVLRSLPSNQDDPALAGKGTHLGSH